MRIDPKWLLARQWRAQKRAELRQVIKAWRRYWCGAAFCPSAGGADERIHAALTDLRKALSVRQWGR